MSDPSRPPPESVEEALERTRAHARQAAAESVHAVHALLDAVALAVGDAPAQAHPSLAAWSLRLEQLAEQLAGDPARSWAPLTRRVLDALNAEIARFEERSLDEDDARSVLRALLSLREVLWELGLRPQEPAERSDDGAQAPEGEPEDTAGGARVLRASGGWRLET